MEKITTVGIDLAKNTFSLHGVDGRGQLALRKTVSRSRLMELVAQLPPCLIGLEASSGAHEWARLPGVRSHRANHGAQVRSALPEERQERR